MDSVHDDNAACRRCFLPHDFPGIELTDGHCKYCRVGTQPDSLVRARTTNTLDDLKALLKERLASYEGQNGQYDCIVGCSGGLDSSYVLYVAQKELGLRPLAVSYDHGFSHSFTRKNLERICDNLSVELRFTSSKRDLDKRFVRHMYQALEPLDNYWGICLFCHYVLDAAVFQIAAREKIPVMFVSDNHYEALKLDKKPKIKAILSSLRRVPPSSYKTMTANGLWAGIYLTALKLEHYTPPLSNLVAPAPKRPKNLKLINLTRYTPWDIPVMVEKLQSVGWQKPDYVDLPMRFDCLIEESVVNHTWKKHTGATVHQIICSNLIHEGLATREDLADTVAYYEEAIPQSILKLRDKLGI